MNRWKDRQMDRWIDIWMDRWIDGQMDRYMDGEMDRRGRLNCVVSSLCVKMLRIDTTNSRF